MRSPAELQQPLRVAVSDLGPIVFADVARLDFDARLDGVRLFQRYLPQLETAVYLRYCVARAMRALSARAPKDHPAGLPRERAD
ncbi:MAG TPA: hypothetical protein VE198_01435 [Actinoallomurus sp.]|jgi:hypothetical protein|nr:hypothetical protein [Actinoallomurus sp.]